eukprot:10525722-Lingulodinium_polyedra.AAC.1
MRAPRALPAQHASRAPRRPGPPQHLAPQAPLFPDRAFQAPPPPVFPPRSARARARAPCEGDATQGEE